METINIPKSSGIDAYLLYVLVFMKCFLFKHLLFFLYLSETSLLFISVCQ